MSKIEELIQQYCPDGVEYVKLGEVAEVYKGEQFNKSLMKNEGTYPVLNGGKNPSGFTEKFNELENTITISQGGASAGFVNFMNCKFWLGAHCYAVKPNKDVLNRYLFHFVKNKELILQQCQYGAGIPALAKQTINDLSIPIPPLAVQEEIVRILDKFSLLTAELEAELELRRKQYDFYRNQLLSFDSDSDTVQWKKLGEVAELIRGGNFQKKDFTEVGIPCIHYGQIYTHFGIHTTQTIKCVSKEIAAKSRIAKQNDIVMAITSENVEDVGKCVAWLGNEDIAVSGHTVIIHHNQNAKYLSYFFHTEHFAMQKKKMAHGTKVIEISPDALNKTIIPIPPLSEQQRIVDILDRFDALVNDLSAGLPAEIEARRKQYEYYRDTLLTFKRKAE